MGQWTQLLKIMMLIMPVKMLIEMMIRILEIILEIEIFLEWKICQNHLSLLDSPILLWNSQFYLGEYLTDSAEKNVGSWIIYFVPLWDNFNCGQNLWSRPEWAGVPITYYWQKLCPKASAMPQLKAKLGGCFQLKSIADGQNFCLTPYQWNFWTKPESGLNVELTNWLFRPAHLNFIIFPIQPQINGWLWIGKVDENLIMPQKCLQLPFKTTSALGPGMFLGTFSAF